MFRFLRLFRGYGPPGGPFTSPASKIEAIPVPHRISLNPGDESTPVQFSVRGDFPRRVASGEILGEGVDVKLLSPFPGVARWDEQEKLIQIKPEGGLSFGSRPEIENTNAQKLLDNNGFGENRLDAFQRLILKSGIPSIDYPEISFIDMINRVVGRGPVQIILSQVEYAAGIDWVSIFSNRKSTPRDLSGFLSAIIPGVEKVHIFPGRKISLNAAKGVWLPEMVAARVLSGTGKTLKIGVPIYEQSILYIGPAMMMALLDMLFENQPFLSRLVAITFHDSASSLSESTALFKIPAGYRFLEFLEERYGDLKGYQIYNGSFGRREQREIKRYQLKEFFPYLGNVFNIVKEGAIREANGRAPCVGCSLCERACPVNASPLSIALGMEERFNKERCLVCGVCEHVCPGGVGLMDRIRQITPGVQN